MLEVEFWDTWGSSCVYRNWKLPCLVYLVLFKRNWNNETYYFVMKQWNGLLQLEIENLASKWSKKRRIEYPSEVSLRTLNHFTFVYQKRWMKGRRFPLVENVTSGIACDYIATPALRVHKLRWSILHVANFCVLFAVWNSNHISHAVGSTYTNMIIVSVFEYCGEVNKTQSQRNLLTKQKLNSAA
mgnify:CR=1 FL=1